MLISEKQRQANLQNARHSTGPTTPEGKSAVRLNALTYGLRARDLLLPGENQAEYAELWDDLQADWQPQNRTERMYLEQMATSQWLLARIARGECRVYLADELPLDKQLALLREVSTQRARLERSFTSALHELKALQNQRRAQHPPRVPPKSAARSTAAPAPAPEYVMSANAADRPVPMNHDSR